MNRGYSKFNKTKAEREKEKYIFLVWQVNTMIQMPAWHGANVSVMELVDLLLI